MTAIALDALLVGPRRPRGAHPHHRVGGLAVVGSDVVTPHPDAGQQQRGQQPGAILASGAVEHHRRGVGRGDDLQPGGQLVRSGHEHVAVGPQQELVGGGELGHLARMPGAVDDR
ncbi:MAG TPA: hypothetical protein PLV68_05055 [Ilumatobacteraceae bacterium]|nr:hypothetical protein [Ilumatobacteraceae bacterium]